MLVSGHDDGSASFDQRVEGMQELALGGPGSGQEMNIIDGQCSQPAMTISKARQESRLALIQGSCW